MSINKFTPPTNRNWGNLGFIKSLILMVVMIVATSNAYAQTTYEVIGGLRYLFNSDDKTAKVVESEGDKYSGEYYVPEKVKSSDGNLYEVVEFADECFHNCPELTKINIPNTVKRLGENCFCNCNKLADVKIPSSVETLGSRCFCGCYAFKDIEIPSSISELPYSCFFACEGIESIILPDNISKLGWACFAYCYKLRTLKIPASLKDLPFETFYDCKGLLEINIPTTIEVIGNSCFYNCAKLETIFFRGKTPDNVENSQIPTNCVIRVPALYLEEYKNKFGSSYSKIYTLEGDKASKCDSPMISYEDGYLRIYSPTEGAKCCYTITADDAVTNKKLEVGNPFVKLSGSYFITAYANADGYLDSDIVSAMLYWLPIGTESTDNINKTKTRGIVASANDGIVCISGLKNGEIVTFYDLDGKQLGVSKAENGYASCTIKGTLIIAKIGNQSIKLVVRR